MRCSMCGMNDCCGADMEQEIDALRAEVARLRAENAELQAYVALINWATGILWRERDALRAQIAAHEKVCAGVWVPVSERVPAAGVEVPVITADGKLYIAPFDPVYEVWLEYSGVKLWIDAKIPSRLPEEEK